MKIEVCNKYEDGEMKLVNAKGCEEIEIDIFNDLTIFSTSKQSRIIGLYKDGLYKMTLKSWKALKKHLNQTNQMYRYAA